jgi:hypothetical protein
MEYILIFLFVLGRTFRLVIYFGGPPYKYFDVDDLFQHTKILIYSLKTPNLTLRYLDC